jgi:hypothetical protein
VFQLSASIAHSINEKMLDRVDPTKAFGVEGFAHGFEDGALDQLRAGGAVRPELLVKMLFQNKTKHTTNKIVK